MKKNATVTSLKNENKGLLTKIKIINVLSYILAVIFILMIELRIVEIFNYIENDNDFFLIVGMAVLLTGLISILMYFILAVPSITKIENKIERNKYEIYKIKDAEKEEMQSLYNKAKFFAIQREIKDLHNIQ